MVTANDPFWAIIIYRIMQSYTLNYYKKFNL